MKIRKFGCPFFIEEAESGCYISNSHGFVMESEEAIELAIDIIRFAKKHEDFLIDKNIEVDKYYEDMMNGRYSYDVEKKPKKKSSVYMFRFHDRFKIGVSIDVERRLKELNNRPYPVELVSSSVPMTCAYEVEKEIHEDLEEYRVDGEWFNLPKDVAVYISELIAGIIPEMYGGE